MLEVPLNPGSGGTRRATLRELTGREEAQFSEPRPLLASELVERLWVSSPAAPRDARTLGVAERDRILAELYLRYYGDRVESVATCDECREPFGVAFPLRPLIAAALRPPEAPLAMKGPDDEGAYRLEGGCRFRLPTLGDERALAALPVQELAHRLLERCVLEGRLDEWAERVEEAMGALAPELATEIRVICAHCGAEKLVWFDIGSFLIAALARERPLLAREVHCLARAYGWTHGEIMALSRSERREYVALVLAETDATRELRA